MIKYALIILLSATVFSCREKSEKQEVASDNIQVSFVKLDSVQIDYVGNLIVHDLSPASRTVLFEERGEYSQEIILADFDGKIISSFSKFGDMPDTYGILLSSMRLLDDNSFLVYGSNGFLTYDLKESCYPVLNWLISNRPIILQYLRVMAWKNCGTGIYM